MSTQTLMMKSSSVMERRRHPRLRLSYLLRLFRPGTTAQGLSCDGFYCISDHPVQPHERIECELLIPSEQLGESSEPDLVLRCRAEVVRVVADRLAPRFGVACRLEDYTINRNSASRNLAVCHP